MVNTNVGMDNDYCDPWLSQHDHPTRSVILNFYSSVEPVPKFFYFQFIIKLTIDIVILTFNLTKVILQKDLM